MLNRDTVWSLRPGQKTDQLVSEHIFNDYNDYFLYSTEMDAAWKIVKKLRSKDYLVCVKAMPRNGSFIIDGSHSEYDAPCVDRKAFEGETVVEIQSMNGNYKNVFSHDLDEQMAICKAALLLFVDGGLN